MAIPKQVQKQSEEVQALYKELNQESKPEAEENIEETPAVEVQPSGSVEEQAPKSEADEPSTSDTQDKEEDWQQKYKSLQGMYNADVPRLNATNRELSSRVSQLEGLLGTMQNQPAPTPAPAEKLITEDDVKEYGDSINIMRKAAREEVAQANNRVAQLESKLNQLQAVVPKVQAQQQQTSEQAFWAKVASDVPNWNEINNDQGFQNWLLEIDPLTNIQRQTYLEDAQKSLDGNRAVQFFRAWEQANGKPSAQSTRPSPNPQLQKQVAPGRSRSGSAPNSGEPATYTPADITQFFTDVRKGKYKGREDERGRIERDIFAAQAEGRIVNA